MENFQAWRQSKKVEPKKEINSPVRKLAEALFDIKSRSGAGEDERIPKIQVSDAAGALAFLYEKLRTIVDDKEERLLRKYAIERILKRKLLIEGANQGIGMSLIKELIHARYLPNKSVPESKADEIEHVIDKYLYLKQQAEKLDSKKGGDNFDSWLIGLMACEIEVKLRQDNIEQPLIEFTYSIIKDDLIFKGQNLSDKEKELQILVAAQRVLAKADKMVSSYFILRLYYPDWSKADQKLLDEMAANISLLRETINRHLLNPAQERIFIILQKEAIIYNVLTEVIWANPEAALGFLAKPETLEKEARKVCASRHKAAKIRMSGMALRSIIYIFITKIFLAVGIEVPVDFYILNQINPVAIGVNVAFPPLYMFFLALSVRMPLKKNADRIWVGIKGIVYTDAKRLTYKIRASSRSVLQQLFFTAIYSLITIVIFGAIIVGLLRLEFSAISILIFILFLCLISFFGMRIRRSSREFIVYRQKEGILASIIDFFFLPVINVGRWLSYKFSKINVFVFFFDFILEAPLKMFIDFLEEWTSFLREKKEEIY
jgi:hypothetical protein